MTSSTPSLAELLFSPRSVALIGASGDPSKTAGRPLRFLRRAGFKGAVYPVNPRRETVQDERAWPSVDALPSVPDHAFILTPTEGVIEAVEACARRGVRLVTVLSTGFAESGAAGLARERRLKEISAATGIRIVGPSSIGIVNLRNGLLLTANAAMAEEDLPAGRTLVLSQSGSLIGAFASRGKARNIGFAGLVSVGNETDLGIGEIGSSTLDDPEIDSYLLFLETIRHAEALRSFLIAARERGKAVVAYKIGRSPEAAELSLSHTGALAGEDDVASAFLADCGVARLDTFDGLLEALPLVRRMPARVGTGRRYRVGILTTTGGGAAMAVDCLAMRGVEVAAPTAQTRAQLAGIGAAEGSGRIVDLTMSGTQYDIMKGALGVMLGAPEFDFVLAVVGSSARLNPQLAVQPIVDSAGAERPLAAFIVPDAPNAHRLLAAGGVPSFRSPESCADAIAAALSLRAPAIGALHARRIIRPGRLCDEAASYAILEKIEIPHAPTLVMEGDSESVPELGFRYPVAVKLLSADVAHKTEYGGVVLNVADGSGVLAAIQKIKDAVRTSRHEITAQRFLIQQMVAGVGEVLVGYRSDPQVGPIVMVAMGGVFAEHYRDRAIRLAPVSIETAREMITEVKGLRTLDGYRGGRKGDLEALAKAIVALSLFAHDPQIFEAEVNPLLVLERGVVAVDAVVRMADDAKPM